MAEEFKGCGYCEGRGELHYCNEIYLFCPEHETVENISGNKWKGEGISDYTHSAKVDQIMGERSCDNYEEGNAGVIFTIEGDELVNTSIGTRSILSKNLKERLDIKETVEQ